VTKDDFEFLAKELQSIARWWWWETLGIMIVAALIALVSPIIAAAAIPVLIGHLSFGIANVVKAVGKAIEPTEDQSAVGA
jgi:uncharacterized membrane protein HdeD (DUF308 family)